MQANLAKISTTDKMTLDNTNKGQNDSCTTDKMTFGNGQNDLIKDNIKDNNLKEKKEKDNNGFAAIAANPEIAAKAAISPIYPIVSVRELVATGAEYELIEDSKDLVRIKATNKIVRVV